MRTAQVPVKNMKRTVSRSLEEGELLIFIDNESASLLEGSTAVVWKLINGKRSTEEIIATVLEKYGGDERKIKKYISESINKLKRMNAIYFKR